jgi:hypothetical protein
MQIDRAEIDENTGCPVVLGRITLNPEACDASVELPDHDRVLLEFRGPRDLVTGRATAIGLAVWAVTAVERQDNGFCRPKVEGPGLFFAGLTTDDIDGLGDVRGSRILIRGGYDCGGLAMSAGEWCLRPFSRFEVRALYSAEGMNLTFCGRLAGEDGSEAGGAPEARADATMSWETMTLAGFQAAAPHWKYERQENLPPIYNASSRSRNPKRLQDTLIKRGLTWPVLCGSLNLLPVPPSRAVFRENPVRFLIAHFDNRQLRFSNAERVQVYADGFATSVGLSCSVLVGLFGREWLEERLGILDQFLLSASGDGLGSINYNTGYGMELGDRFGMISQTIKRLTAHATLTAQGLELGIQGELEDFEPDLIARHRRERNSKLQPLSGFTLQATAPWALLLVRRFRFA